MLSLKVFATRVQKKKKSWKQVSCVPVSDTKLEQFLVQSPSDMQSHSILSPSCLHTKVTINSLHVNKQFYARIAPVLVPSDCATKTRP